MNTFGWNIYKKHELGLETWYVTRYGTLIATFLSRVAAEALVTRIMRGLK